MTIWRDSDYRCHVEEAEGYTAVETDFFNGKCPAFIEGYIFVAYGETWTRADGMTFYGEMITPWMDYAVLEAAQRGYEEAIAEAETAYQEGVNAAYDE